LGKAARATRRVSSGGKVGSSGWSDIGHLTRARGRILNPVQHAPDRRANPPENDFATSVNSLFIQIHDGPDDSGRLLYEGTLKIPAKDFVRQLATIEVTGASNILARLNMLRRFSLFFAGQLFDSYAGLGADTAWAAPRPSRAIPGCAAA
jgi:hypothetical protein